MFSKVCSWSGPRGMLGEQRAPEHRLRDERLVGGALDVGGLDREAVGVVALVVLGVHLDSADHAGVTQRDDQPLVAGHAAAGRLPAVAHVDAEVRQEHLARPAVVRVAPGDDARAGQQPARSTSPSPFSVGSNTKRP